MDRSWVGQAQETYPFVLFDFLVHLRVIHPVWSAEAIRKGMGIPREPGVEWSVGKPRTTPKGKPLRGAYKESMITLGFEGRPEECLSECLLRVVGELKRHERFFRRLRGSGGALKFFIGVFIQGNKGVTFDVELLSRLAAMGIELGLDMYDGPSNWAGDPPSDQ